MERNAIFSPCRKYRYVLSRIWDHSKPRLAVIGLNPSTADENVDDPTIRRCINYAKDWGYGGLIMANLFAYRATKPNDMLVQADPIGPENDMHLMNIANTAGMVLAAWGNPGTHLNRGNVVRQLFPTLMCLNLNQNGTPAHPLYQRSDAVPFIYE